MEESNIAPLIEDIYALTDPRNGEVRYIGRASQATWRLWAHTVPSALKADTPKNNWIKELRSLGLKPGVIVLEQSTNRANGDERFWIEYFKMLGANLTNQYPFNRFKRKRPGDSKSGD